MTSEDDLDTNGKIALVTSGSRGIGRSTVLHLAKRGVCSIFTYNANSAEAETVATLASQDGHREPAVQRLRLGHLAADRGRGRGAH